MNELKRWVVIMFIFAGVVAFGASSLHAGENGKAKPVKASATVIIDFTSPGDDSSASVYRFFRKDIYAIADELNKSLPADKQINIEMVLKKTDEAANANESDREKATRMQGVSNEREKFLSELKMRFKKAQEQRWISKKGEKLDVYVFHVGTKGEIKIEEKKRKTRIAQDASVLVKLIVLERTKGERNVLMESRQYTLGKQYGTLSVSAVVDKEKEEKMEILTGPVEHWFLSADLLLVKLSDVKFVVDQGTLEPRETPKVFYIGVNWMIGDIITEQQNLLKNFFLKGMVKFSRKPFDSYGLGIGYRFPGVKVLGIDISAFSAFGAMVWTKESVENNTKTVTKRQWQFGVSFNLDKAMGWIK